jgi:hypothetical protein
MKNAAGVSVDLIGAVHIADGPYYAALNNLFKGYDALLFELVDGQSLKEEFEGKPAKPKNRKPAPATPPSAKNGDVTPPKKAPSSKAKDESPAFTFLRGMMTGIGSYFHLQYQTDPEGGINYLAKNFVHADVSLAEFQRLQEEKGETWGTLMLKAMEAQAKRSHGKADEPKGSQLLLALLGDSSGLKIAMARILGKVESTTEEAGVGGDSVIVGERNRVALEVFDREVKAGRKNLGIFYGAAHLEDMEKRLEGRGYQRTGERWMTAWNIKPRVDEKP